MAETVHADTDRAEPRRRPDAEAYWRSGLTHAEATRRERAETWREETRSPWEASPPGLVVWLVWRALYKGFQPVWLILSLLAAGWFGGQWLIARGDLDPAPADESVSGRLPVAIASAVPPGMDARAFWEERLDAALDGDRRRRADIDRFRAWAALGPDLIGRDRLALEHLAGDGNTTALDAQLRAGPPWERQALMDRALADRLAAGRAAGLEPPELILAPERLRQRHERALFLWSIADTSARAFFQGRARGEFEMRSLPGLVSDDVAGDTRLYGGVRHFVIQACAHRAAAFEGCDAAIIPDAPADMLAFSLAAIEAGLVQLQISPSVAMPGAEVLQAASRAGRLTEGFRTALEADLAAVLSSGEALVALSATGLRADIAFAAPDQTALLLRGGIDARTREGAGGLSEMLRDIAAIRAQTSPAVAIRLLDGLAGPDDVRRLRGLVDVAGDRSLAVRELLGPRALEAAEPAIPAPVVESADQDRLKRNAMLALISAAVVVLLTLVRLATPRRIRLGARTNLADAWMSRLTLGRKT
ncbi:hypothetical protein [Maricaulis sp.]|uniref:hypothetical protein n=1 Tax=Maricaulis sp. TaxID=1486257 RepID=UPI001B0AE840|nr:hypothetical protein [Maricaulis sp.]MBO6765081.1 hypothetical protein [Maricaulis sp.]